MKVNTNSTSKQRLNFDVTMIAEKAKRSDNIKISQIKKLSSEALFADAKEVMIEHQSETYILRITKQNKLILTK